MSKFPFFSALGDPAPSKASQPVAALVGEHFWSLQLCSKSFSSARRNSQSFEKLPVFGPFSTSVFDPFAVPHALGSCMSVFYRFSSTYVPSFSFLRAIVPSGDVLPTHSQTLFVKIFTDFEQL